MNLLVPGQEQLYEAQGKYWYRLPQGENVPDVRDRWRSVQNTLVREYAEQDVLIVTHHLSILALRANLEGFDDKEFIRLDDHEKPVNCGVTVFRGHPDQGSDGKLVMETYNEQLYQEAA